VREISESTAWCGGAVNGNEDDDNDGDDDDDDDKDATQPRGRRRDRVPPLLLVERDPERVPARAEIITRANSAERPSRVPLPE
jgi:hypothetical protein